MHLTSLNLKADRTKLAQMAKDRADLADQVRHIPLTDYPQARVEKLVADARWTCGVEMKDE